MVIISLQRGHRQLHVRGVVPARAHRPTYRGMISDVSGGVASATTARDDC